MKNLIRRLPADSQLAKEVNGESAEWSQTDHLLAIVADRIADLHWAYVSVNSEDEVERPEPIPRPGIEDKPEVEAATQADMASFFTSM